MKNHGEKNTPLKNKLISEQNGLMSAHGIDGCQLPAQLPVMNGFIGKRISCCVFSVRKTLSCDWVKGPADLNVAAKNNLPP